ncbi:hypothetical protein B0F90DRAFT_1621379 [Multifurca ochricompacta]|uniref:1-phosphatidylinositol-3-phosphate 5-kinase n=1 Tax=Multifurca ochricompacta TaxID=376703 RepID=A0AAD4QQL3_9AGAM|nr:hypothetical protein B0F90DRAFT_1621379 [Multifurca ochricompacta]
MDSPSVLTEPFDSSSASSASQASGRALEDVASLTSFNPFSEEDENDQSSYALMSSLFSKVKNTFSTPLSSVPPPATIGISSGGISNGTLVERRRPSTSVVQNHSSNESSRSSTERPSSLTVVPSHLAPPLVSLTPVVSEGLSFNIDFDVSLSRGAFINPSASDNLDSGLYGTTIPGFSIPEDARSIRTAASVKRSASVSKVIRRIRGEGLSRDYWMDDKTCKECYDCKSVFTAWRRKHHCRICGQIFCSRCASNIIKGSRFGHDGMIRVCNLCLEKLANVDEDDDDDRRSISSVVSPFAAHQFGSDSMAVGLARHPQSPFAASQLFSRMDEPFNLFSIAETRRLFSRSDEGSFASRPLTPLGRSLEDSWGSQTWKATAPFRRGLVDDDKDLSIITNTFPRDSSPVASGAKTPLDFPATIPVPGGATSSIQFPLSSPDRLPDSPGSQSMPRSRYNSYADFDYSTPFIRSRVQSRLTDFITIGEPGWRTRRESTAYAQELNLVSMSHLHLMLRQMLTKENIPNVLEWEEALLKLALRIARELTFTAHPHRQGPDMDVRRYVKIKKIPGGAPKDSEYVDGAVITKNVAHKSMTRLQRHPRVMLVTFPLEFSRVEGQYMHFGQIVRQEKEYLGNLVSRIAAYRPHVVLAENSVSRLALDALAKQGIAVARSVKPSAIQFVARMTQADVFSSMDKLALEPRLGHCTRFRIQTFDHPLIPGHRKTYMRFEGCNREMGCTIVLRGGDRETLRRIKHVTRFLTFIVRSLKLETHLWKDSIIALPALTTDAVPSSYPFRSGGSDATFFYPGHQAPSLDSTPMEHDSTEADLPYDDAEQLRLSRRIQQVLDPYLTTFTSVSATLRFSPPYPLSRMKELDDELIRAKQAWEDEVVRREEKQPVTSTRGSTSTPKPLDYDDVKNQMESLTNSALVMTPSPGETLPAGDEPGYFDYKPSFASSQATLSAMLPAVRTPIDEFLVLLKSPDDISLESRYTLVKWQHQEQQRIWEWYLRKNADDFVVEKYQCISLREYTLPTEEHGRHAACFPPSLHYITYYGENDCTLGQFIESSIADTLSWSVCPKQPICTGKGCNQTLARHCKVYVHNESKIFMAVEPWDGQIVGLGPTPELITTWSACRICDSATPFIPVSEEMQRYSFAKFLELHFYPADVQLVEGAGCEHNIYRHHIRYFAKRGMTLQFQADPIVLHEIVFPPMRIRVRPETQLVLKNADYDRLMNRNSRWYAALVHDLNLIRTDAATGDEETDAKLTAELNQLILRAESEKAEVVRMINEIYRESLPTDTLALNQVRSYLQDKIVAWQVDFDKLPKPKGVRTDKSGSGRRASTFGTVRAIWPRRFDLPGAYDHAVPSPSVSEAEETVPPAGMRRGTADSFVSASSASEASETEGPPGKAKANGSQDLEEAAMLVNEPSLSPEPVPLTKSDPESDSTIGAPKAGRASTSVMPEPSTAQPLDQNVLPSVVASSKLPRRQVKRPSVAELVKKYSEFLPSQGVEELAKTALSPRLDTAESEQESATPWPKPQSGRSRFKRPLARRPSASDFESSYAANVAPRYLTHSRRQARQPSHSSRIPGPVNSSNYTSRQHSPEKPVLSADSDIVTKPGLPGNGLASGVVGRSTITKQGRNLGKDKNQPRTVSGTVGKGIAGRRGVLPPGNRVSNIAKHFERISKDNERANRRYAVIRGRRARPVASFRAKVKILDSVKDAIQDESENSDSSSEADDEGGDEEDAQKSSNKVSPEASGTLPDRETDDEPKDPAPAHLTEPNAPASSADSPGVTSESPLASRDTLVSIPSSPYLSSTADAKVSTPSPLYDLDLGPSGQERNSLLKALSGFWPQNIPHRSRMDDETDDPINDPEHIFRDSSMVVRTDEPTSIIALALNSQQYRDMLSKSRAEKRQSREPRLTEGGEAFMPDDRSVAGSTSTWGVVHVDPSENGDPTDELRAPSSKLPWAITFESGGLTISCTVLYPEQFDALRRTYDCDKSMIESLARCVKWNASGGKSGSAFLKTLDDRFIAKEMSRTEFQTMESFAPSYFAYMSSAVSANRPTLLAKVFGCYKISFKKSGKDRGTGRWKSTQMNLIVMENLFYDRRFSKIYDLKGSTRNRHVKSTGRENEVLLDENLVQTAHLAPFYLREHSKRILRGALYNDSKFLADINVMDYSLVVGVDSIKNELVVGIVDYVRTYTLDKKLETWVKESGFLGGAGKGEPTVVTPKLYRQRFVSAMERYFPLVPDRWMKQKDAPEEEGNILLDLWPDW